MAKLNKPIEEILLESSLITPQQLEQARQEARKLGLDIERSLIKLGFISEEAIVAKIAEITSLPYINLADYQIDSEIIKLVPEDLARKYKIIPLFRIEDTLTVVMANPNDIAALDELRIKTNFKYIDTVISTKTQIENALNRYYGTVGDIETVIEGMDISQLKAIPEELEPSRIAEIVEETPVIKLVNLLITRAVKDRASDIHIEPEEDLLRIRYRIDGILYEVYKLPKYLLGLITSRIKVLANLDIAERRKPQDGRIRLNIENREIDIRTSTFPTIHGENVVLRILDKSNLLLDLNELGFSQQDLSRFNSLIHRPNGIILVTGPTGSGKTTTLYAALSAINSLETNIITLEDPVEYELPLIRQTQINPKAGLTFATGLRSILRQDPDIIMVGEIRDVETAEIAIQAALTGHLVFSTLHTNDAPGALTRLIDMGIEPFLISSSVIGVLAQRLVRKICADCKTEYIPSPELISVLGIKETEIKFYKGKGCPNCKQTGYSGRIGIFELLVVNEEIRKLIVSKASADIIKQKAIALGMSTLKEDGLNKVKQGITTLEEIFRLTQIQE
ncbi:MAG: type II secretion system ATPase GspE [Candidatus Omnitrophica bacterium]|nr:type II secretion system ATPase GspE [Candidatus Omnitrophota bacterium]